MENIKREHENIRLRWQLWEAATARVEKNKKRLVLVSLRWCNEAGSVSVGETASYIQTLWQNEQATYVDTWCWSLRILQPRRLPLSPAMGRY